MKRKVSVVLTFCLLITMMTGLSVQAAEDDLIDVFVEKMVEMKDKNELVELVRMLAFVDGTTTVKDAYSAAFGQFSSPDQTRWIHFKRTMDMISNLATKVVKDSESMVTIETLIGSAGSADAVGLEKVIRENESEFLEGLNSVTENDVIEGFRQLAIVFDVLNDSKAVNDLGFSIPLFLTDTSYVIKALNEENALILIGVANEILGSPTNDEASIVNGLRSFIQSYNSLSSEDINVVYGYLNQRGFMGVYTGEEDELGLEITIKDERVAQGFSFTDIGGVEWANRAINRLYTAGVINGKDPVTFDPTSNVTRAEFAAMITRMLELVAVSDTGVFDDVNADDWFAAEVMAAYDSGIIEGIGNGKFAPKETLTKQEALTMLSRVLIGHGYSYQSTATVSTILGFYNDSTLIADWAESSIALTVSLGIGGAPSDNAYVFGPKDIVNRAEAAVMLFDLAKLVATNVDTVDHNIYYEQ